MESLVEACLLLYLSKRLGTWLWSPSSCWLGSLQKGAVWDYKESMFVQGFVVCFPFVLANFIGPYSMPKNLIFFPRTPEFVMYRASSVSIESDGNWRSLQASNYTMDLYPVFPFSLSQQHWRNHLKWLQVWCRRQYNISRSFWKHKSKHDSFWACSKTEKQTLLHLLNLLLFVDMNTVNSACFTQGSICVAIWPLITRS